MPKRTVRSSEVRSYSFILDELEKRGWNIVNPKINPSGEVFTQDECHSDKRIADQLGKTKPENTIKLSDNEFYVIEAKSEKDEIDKALKEAKEDYAEVINQSKEIKAKIISGVAGNKTNNTVVNQFLENRTWKTIKVNGKELTGLVSKKIAKLLLEKNSAEIEDLPLDEKELLVGAERINEIMHMGSIDKGLRAKVISAILLSMVDDTEINLDEDMETLAQIINIKVSQVLRREGKPDFHTFVSMPLPSSAENHVKFREAVVETYHELYRLNIRSAMNSGTDILGKFYEVFLKYGNGAKEIGIVLTPRHITKFACDILDVNKNDLIYDPTCGTGGFLVSAFDKIKKEARPAEIENFKQYNLFGVEEQDHVIALAIVNMIFRGDGKTNIMGGNCFNKWLTESIKDGKATAKYLDSDAEGRTPPITKVLMNPPFALKKSAEKEFKFIEQALKQMHGGGLLFSILPSSAMVKSGKYLNWRKNSLLKENTLLAVITFPDDLFYPIGVLACAVIIKKGVSHPQNQNVLWIKVREDGLLKSKGKRLPNSRAKNELETITPLIKEFIRNPSINVSNLKQVQKANKIDFANGVPTDKNIELLPEVFLDEKKPTETELESAVEETLRQSISFMILGNKIGNFEKEVITGDLFSKKRKPLSESSWKEVPVTELFTEPDTGLYHVSAILDAGEIPLISCSTVNNGAEGYFQIPQEHIHKNAITIASDGAPLTSFLHYYPFTAKDNVIIAIPKSAYRFTTMLFFTTQLNRLRWRFSYGRKCYLNKIHKIKIFLPHNKDNKIDEDYIEYLFKKSPSWHTLEKLFA